MNALSAAEAVGAASAGDMDDRRPSVIFVREWEQQMSGSGCCGRLAGDVLVANGEHIFAERRAVMEGMGAALSRHQARIRRRVWMSSSSIRAIRSRSCQGSCAIYGATGSGIRAALRTLSGIAIPTVIVNGRIFSRGVWPDTAATIGYLRDLDTEGRAGGAVA